MKDPTQAHLPEAQQDELVPACPLTIEEWQANERELRELAKKLKCRPSEVDVKARELIERIERREVEIAQLREEKSKSN